MILLRFLLLAFNVAIITFLVYRMLIVIREPMDRSKKAVIIIGAIILLLVPVGIFLQFFGAGPQYFIVYPVAVLLFLYLTKQMPNF
jgi:hypothetical protein